jgi:UDP-N-acetylmuramoyl-tripeptide--D-alanyl-D-alanine ligase
VSIDSRTVGAGELFVGIRGERFDGADFGRAAAENGAAGVLVARGRGRSLGAGAVAVIEVDDAIAALQTMARAVRARSGATVVAITGSAGKTTTKEITAELLACRYRVIRNRGNLNNHIGLPLSLMELTAQPDVAVVELGMSHAGEIRTLIGIAAPDIRVWLNAGEAHLGFFESVDAIADAKAEILEAADARTVLVANADDDRIVARTRAFAGRTVTFGIDRAADVRALAVHDRGVEGTSARVTTPRGSIDLTTALVGRGNLANVLAAASVALEFDLPLEAIAQRAGRLGPASHRGEVVRLAGDVTLIDDSYNANPTATRLALDVLRGGSVRRRVAVLGEMLELGDRAVALHQDVGRAAAAADLGLLLTVGGPAAAAMADAAVAAGLGAERVRYAATSDEAAEALTRLVRPGDLVLVKGSRGVRTDRIVERLKAERA